MFRFTFALALLFVGAFTRSTLAAFAQEQARSLGLEYERRPHAVLSAASELEQDAAKTAEAIDAHKQTDHWIRDNEGAR